jgi:hypothetical protein
MAVTISRNPRIAYDQGYKAGQAQGLHDVFMTHTYVLLLAMYNAKNEDIISDEYFAEFAKETEKEISHILNYYFDGDICKIQALRNYKEELLEDRVKQLLTKVSEMRQRCGMEKI